MTKRQTPNLWKMAKQTKFLTQWNMAKSPILDLHVCKNDKQSKIPDRLVSAQPAVTPKVAEMSVPQLSKESAPKVWKMDNALLKEQSRLKHASELLEKDEEEEGDTVVWSAFPA